MADNQLRITSHGKIKAYVAFALKFFEKNETESLVIHTLPHTKPGETAVGDLSSATTIIPRLVSVVEIIKREYIKLLQEQRSTRLIGLHQYNQIGTLEDLGYGNPQETVEDRDKQIEYALSGKNHVKLKQTPYMKITLSLERIPELEKTATYQPPHKRKISRSAKSRMKKRNHKAEVGVTQPQEEETEEDNQMEP